MDYREESIRTVLEDYGIIVFDDLVKDLLEALDACDEYASYSYGGAKITNEEAEEEVMR